MNNPDENSNRDAADHAAKTTTIQVPPVVAKPLIGESDLVENVVLVSTAPRPNSTSAPGSAPLNDGGDSPGNHVTAPDSTQSKSRVARVFSAVGHFLNHVVGIVSVIFLLALTSNIPIIQFASFGYLLEVSGRLARQQSFRDAMVGLKKARFVGLLLLGTWLMLMPIRLVSQFWLEAFLIDPTSIPTRNFRIGQIILVAITLLHIGSVWLCGGKFRYFFWPLIAPFSIAIHVAKRLVGNRIVKRILNWLVGWFSPKLVDRIFATKPVSDWFVPSIIWNRVKQKNLYRYSRDAVWEFLVSLRPSYYLWLGFKGFVGTFLWLLIPTSLLVATSFSEGGTSILSGLLGTITAIPVFAILPFLQVHFARDGKLSRFLEVRTVFRNCGRAPLAHLVALLVTLVLAIPLFLLKIEQIPSELNWALSLVFVMFSWPARLVNGWAYQRGVRKETLSRWWFRYPIFTMSFPISLTFVLILTVTRYISWAGAISLFENHVFLLPSPFWLN